MRVESTILQSGEQRVRDGQVATAAYGWAAVQMVAVLIVVDIVAALLSRILRPFAPIFAVFAGPTATGDPLSFLTDGRLMLLCAAIFAIAFAAAFAMAYSRGYLLTNRRLIIRRGIIARSITTADVSRLQDVRIRQNMIQRLLDYGNVTVETAGTSGSLVLRDVHNPQVWADALHRPVPSTSFEPTFPSSDFRHPAEPPSRVIAPPAILTPGWHPDPVGRHQTRYWDGSRWTEHVANSGQPGLDPV